MRDRAGVRERRGRALLAVDGRGVPYGVWQDSRFSHGDGVLVVSSRDGGTGWSRPRRIGAPRTEGLIPAVAAQGSGRFAVLYLRVTSGATLQARYRLAVSRDRGRHFADAAVSRTFSITDAPHLTASPFVPGGYFVGD